jgi:restriction system protein
MGRKARRRRAKLSDRSGVLGVVLLIALLGLVRVVQENPVVSTLLAVVVVAVLVVAWVVRQRLRREQAAAQAERDRAIEVTDGMDGRSFEAWTARLLVRSGCSDVRVVGGAGDAGADLLAMTPGGHRIVVQCKRYDPVSGKITSPQVQLFSGTARLVHGAQIPIMITTARYTRPAHEVAGKAGIVLIDRIELARWAATGVAPRATGIAQVVRPR